MERKRKHRLPAATQRRMWTVTRLLVAATVDHDLQGEQRDDMRTYRTVLEQKIRERQQTFEEFAADVEKFAREHKEPGTLGVRHLQRLVAGRRADGRPLGPVKPTTARLLEHMLGVGIDELLSSPSMQGTEAGSDHDLRQQLDASSKVGDELISLLNAQLANIRALDRQMGATIVGNEVEVKADQVAQLIKYSLSDRIRRLLARLLSELHTLAGWQSLDQGRVMKSWQHYETAKSAALESCAPAFEAYATAEQAFVLLDINETNSALDLLVAARRIADAKCSPMLRSWMAAAHGEALAAFGNRAESLRAFDKAAALLPVDIADLDGPYVTLDPVHLARWRGHALARFADPDAVDVLTSALDRLDPTFTRAEAALRVDLAVVLSALNESVEANIQANRARSLAVQVGSFRQTMRLTSLIPCVQANGS